VSVPLERCPRAATPALVDRGRAIGAYDGALRAIIHALKYEDAIAGAALGALMRRRGADMLEGAVCAIPVRSIRRGAGTAASTSRRSRAARRESRRWRRCGACAGRRPSRPAGGAAAPQRPRTRSR